MKRNLSIKTIVLLAFTLFSTILIIGYSVLSARFFNLGVSHVIKDNMESTIENYHRSIPPQKRKNVDYWGSYRITTNWQFVPTVVKNNFTAPIPPSKELFIAEKIKGIRDREPNWYLMAIRKGDTIYYISQWAGFSTPLGTLGWNSNENLRFLIVLSCFIGIGLTVIIWLIIRQITRPMIALNHWAGQLGKDTCNSTTPNFQYRELNELASLIHEKISTEHKRLENDQQFIHFASHELRTPITIIAQNIEMLTRLKKLKTKRAAEIENKALKRLTRAATNMETLINTLLWSGRKTTKELLKENVRIDLLLKELVKSQVFLLKGKKVRITLNIEKTWVRVTEPPLRIVLTNLIRNAFHHSSSGRVIIVQTSGQITITNPVELPESNLGFGFGLNLISKLVDKMNWHYVRTTDANTHTVVININRPRSPRLKS